MYIHIYIYMFFKRYVKTHTHNGLLANPLLMSHFNGDLNTTKSGFNHQKRGI